MNNFFMYKTPSAPTDDELLRAARTLVIEQRRCRCSLIQRHLRIGYISASKIIELLEAEGTVSPDSNGVRTVLIK